MRTAAKWTVAVPGTFIGAEDGRGSGMDGTGSGMDDRGSGVDDRGSGADVSGVSCRGCRG
eukprot:6269972-Pyramimonas_sp.AAC.2